MPRRGNTYSTLQKRLVREAVEQMLHPFTAGQLCDSLAARRPRVSRATVYRVLAVLCEEGSIREFWLPNGKRVCTRREDSVVCIVECADCGKLECSPPPRALDSPDFPGQITIHQKWTAPAGRPGRRALTRR